MAIRYLAEELYRLTKKVEDLERQLAALGTGPAPDRARLEVEIIKTRKDRDHIRDVLESKKEKTLV